MSWSFQQIAAFRQYAESFGISPPTNMIPRKFYRYPGVGKPKGNRSGWCILSSDGKHACFGDWSSDLNEVWWPNQAEYLSDHEKEVKRSKAMDARSQHEQARVAAQADARKRASSIWDQALPASEDHPYLLRKGIKPYGARLYRQSLVLALQDFEGRLHSLQFIACNGGKILLKGGRKAGMFIHVAGNAEYYSNILICEGYATGCSLVDSQPDALVLSAIDAGNLKFVAVNARIKWPDANIIICGDDDRLTPNNPGRRKATAAAFAANALAAFPRWPMGAPELLSDFNDLVQYMRQGGGQ